MAETKKRWAHKVKGMVLTIRDGMTVVPYEQTRGGWYAVVVEALSEQDRKSYPRGGYNILVTNADVENAIERQLVPIETEIQDMRQPGEAWCSDCPDHEACSQGMPCSMVKRVSSRG